MNAADTNASNAIADCTPLTVVSRSCTTAAIDTFINEVSTTSTNIAIASRIANRRFSGASTGSLLLACSVIRVSSPTPVRCGSARALLVGWGGPTPEAVLPFGDHLGSGIPVRCVDPAAGSAGEDQPRAGHHHHEPEDAGRFPDQ